MSKPNVPEILRRAIAYHQEGSVSQAEALYQEILVRDPRCADAAHLLGVAALQVGRREVAVDLIRRAIKLSPNQAHFHSNLGEAYRGLARFDEAIASLRHSLALKPDFPAALNSLGVVLAARHQTDEAVTCYQKAILLDPNNADAHHNLGAVFSERGELEKAEACFRRVLVRRPHDAEAHASLGNVLKKGGQLDEAVTAYQQAIAITPNVVEAYNNLGETFKEQGRSGEAIACYRRAIALNPSLAAVHSNLIYTLHFDVSSTAKAIHEEHQRWCQQHVTPLAATFREADPDRNGERRLRVGYVSPDFCDQAECFFVLPLLEAHDRSLYEIHAYSSVNQPDHITARFRQAVDVWHDVRTLDDDQLAKKVVSDRVDILIDLTMHMANNRLLVFARKPSPVQVTWLAYPATTGLNAINYRLTDSLMESAADPYPFSAEVPVRLPESWCCYHPVTESPPCTRAPARVAGKNTFGSLNNFFKNNDAVLRRWAHVLTATPDSSLLLLCPSDAARDRVRLFMTQAGIAAERLEFVGRQQRYDYLSTYQRIDVALDPFPYNGITTTLDALWMGVPVLTLPGALPPARAGLSLLTTLGLTEMIAHSEDDYIRRAVSLACDLPRLAANRADLREHLLRSPLMDAPRFARNVESAYRTMWRQRCARV